MKKRTCILSLLVLVLVCLFLAACQPNDNRGDPAATTVAASPTAAATTTAAETDPSGGYWSPKI